MRLRWLMTVSLLLLGPAWPASAQPTSSTLRGRVHDVQGTALPGASVTVSGRANGISRTVATDATGEFIVANLPPGTVTVTTASKGFSVATRSVVLEVGQVVALDIEMSVSPVKQDVTVVGAPVAVDTTRSVVDAVMPSAFIEALPLNGRNFLELALLVPGQRTCAELRSDEVEHGRHFVGRRARPRRQHHNRRIRQQRRCGRRNAAEHHAGSGPGVPDRNQPLHRRIGPVGHVGHQCGHEVRHGAVPRIVFPLRAQQPLAVIARHRRPDRIETALRQGTVRRGGRRAARCAEGVLVRRAGISEPGRRGAGRGHATRRRARSGGCSPRRRSTTCSDRSGWTIVPAAPT